MISEVDSFTRSPPVDFQQEDTRLPVEYQQQNSADGKTCRFKKLSGTQDIWEVRVQSGSDTMRLPGFLSGSRSLVLTNGFAKKTAKVPPREIALAEQRRR